jgi:hypothetical protein
MKKIGIVTIIDTNNYGNRLQNYALQNVCEEKLNVTTYTLKNHPFSNTRRGFLLRVLKNKLKQNKKNVRNRNREERFLEFDKTYIKYLEKELNCYSNLNYFDFVIAGSDQIWNPTFNRMRDFDLLRSVKKDKRISFSASFGVSNIPKKYNKKLRNELKKFKAISVREEAGKKIINNLSIDKNIEVLVDPTMLLSANEWDKISKKPKQLQFLKKKKYILNYFLGNLSEKRKKEIEDIAKENECEIIDILDKNSPFYETGPSEFVYLEKNAFLICTDSFHSSVFAIIYNRPFVVFNREDKNVPMNSRIETLLSKFKLKNREYNGNRITKENLSHDYTETYKILEEERKKSIMFLKKALDIEKEQK